MAGPKRPGLKRPRRAGPKRPTLPIGAVFADLTDKMVTKLRALGEKPTPENVSKLEQHLERSFRLYRAPKIRPIVLETLAQLPNIVDRYLKLIIFDKEFYDQCSLPVKQQIWIKNKCLFLEAIEPVLDAYILDKERLLLSATIGVGSDKQTNFFTCDSWKGRRQKKHIQELVSMVGQREILYCKLISIIRDRFLATDNPNYCSLHFELLMAAHDVNVEFLARVDPCHDFAWCLDACAKHHRAKLIDSQQMSKLRTLLDTSKKGQSNVVAQLSLIAGDPNILHMIASAAVKTIRDNAFSANPTKPRDLTSVHLMVKMLLMGLHAKDLLTEQKQLHQMMDPEIFTVFLAAFTTMIVQDAIRVELNNAPEEVTDWFWLDRERCPRLPSVDPFLRANPVCALLWVHYLAFGDPLPSSPSKRRPFEAAASLCYLDALLDLARQMAVADPHWAHLLNGDNAIKLLANQPVTEKTNKKDKHKHKPKRKQSPKNETLSNSVDDEIVVEKAESSFCEPSELDKKVEMEAAEVKKSEDDWIPSKQKGKMEKKQKGKSKSPSTKVEVNMQMAAAEYDGKEILEGKCVDKFEELEKDKEEVVEKSVSATPTEAVKAIVRPVDEKVEAVQHSAKKTRKNGCSCPSILSTSRSFATSLFIVILFNGPMFCIGQTTTTEMWNETIGGVNFQGGLPVPVESTSASTVSTNVEAFLSQVAKLPWGWAICVCAVCLFLAIIGERWKRKKAKQPAQGKGKQAAKSAESESMDSAMISDKPMKQNAAPEKTSEGAKKAKQPAQEKGKKAAKSAESESMDSAMISDKPMKQNAAPEKTSEGAKKAKQPAAHGKGKKAKSAASETMDPAVGAGMQKDIEVVVVPPFDETALLPKPKARADSIIFFKHICGPLWTDKAYVKYGWTRVHVSWSGMVVSNENCSASMDHIGRIVSAS
uniref:Uncharacterized protein n=1 Tax=Globodera rostochiensis TaxID=31243 RepID=A0A914HI54_GLORO